MLFIFVHFPIGAYASRGFALKAMAHANAALMASPVLPSLKAKSGSNEFALRPAYFSAESQGDSLSSNYQRSLDYSGSGLALLFHRQMSHSWGFFLTGMGNQIKGDFSTTSQHQGSSIEVDSKGVNSSMYQLASGFTLTMFKDSAFPIQFFAGPSLTNTKVEQTVTSNQGDDFDMTMEPSTMGYMVGAQVGLFLSSWLAFNPYYVVGGMMNAADQCQKFTSKVRSYGPFWDFGEPACQDGQNSSTSKLEYDTSFAAIGLNVLLPTLGVSVNLFAETGEVPGYEGVDLELYYITVSF